MRGGGTHEGSRYVVLPESLTAGRLT
ncbi:hypothetical protein SBRY_40790 [Actinacidiphila bryophytorum]|uniref:Uncharacterized protein n=1 Tax=Actinacidiphila bryophytorum TaxID=1436133 RepID=A0A9W4MIQ9_9ACTN|nr:hypothetical protein SBRY_40790 [Actinacidiphila bryophytorum]